MIDFTAPRREIGNGRHAIHPPVAYERLILTGEVEDHVEPVVSSILTDKNIYLPRIGLKDKLGVDICWGHVLRSDHGSHWVVIYIQETAQYWAQWLPPDDIEDARDHFTPLDVLADRALVVNNIFFMQNERRHGNQKKIERINVGHQP